MIIVFSLLLQAIHTAAMDMLAGSGVQKQCRTADIMADAAYSILTKPKNYTGNFLIDEELLKSEGIKDFDVYAVSPGTDFVTTIKPISDSNWNMLNQLYVQWGGVSLQ